MAPALDSPRPFRFSRVTLMGVAVLVTTTSLASQQPATSPPATPPPATDNVPVRAIDAAGVTLPAAARTAGVRRFAFVVYGDTRGPADGAIVQPQHSDVMNAMLATIRAQSRTPFPIRFVIQSGDAVVNGRFGRQWNTSFTPVIDRLVRDARVPYFFAVGNHDVGSVPIVSDPARVIGLRNTEAAMAGFWPKEGSPQRLAGYPSYWFAYGQLFVLVLDSNIAADATQLAWATDQLRQLDRSRFRQIAVVMHHPALTSGAHGGSTVEPQTEAIRRVYMPLFRRYHVRLLLTGHDHLFDHYVETYTDGDGSHRLDHIVSGGGGAPIYRYTQEPDLERYARSALPQVVHVQHVARPSPNQADNPHHFVVIQVDGDALQARVVSTAAAPFAPWGADTISLTSQPRATTTGQ
jgi:3',5'-cyclic AMP phosphodiesterase CpdA